MITLSSFVQTSAYSHIPSSAPLIVSSETGSGKTLTYLLPLLNDILRSRSPSKYKTSAVVVVPNKELR